MKTKRKIAAIVLLALLGAVAYGLFRTGQPSSAPAVNAKAAYGAAAEGPIVDATPLFTAQRLAQMPTTEEELPFAEEALRLGDHDMDLAFAAAVRDAQEHPPVLSVEAKEIEARLQQSLLRACSLRSPRENYTEPCWPSVSQRRLRSNVPD